MISFSASTPFLLLTSLAGCLADWNGVYDDPIYGGNIHVCVSEIDGQRYGQGTFSRLGYMRGTITSGDVFTGNFWLQGWESTHGSFAMILSGSSYSGTFTQQPGITYTIAGTKTSSVTPTDLKCQKSDDYLLTSTDYYSSTGSYVQQGEDNVIGVVATTIQESEAGKGTAFGAYQYVYSYNGAVDYGTEYLASFLNGQVKTGRWSEGDDASGINMYVAKNATHHYTSWWFISRIADFAYTDATNPDLEGHGLMGKVDSAEIPVDARVADAQVCLELFTTDAETACFSVDSGNNDNCAADSVGVSALLFSVLGFLAAVGFGIVILGEVRKWGSGDAGASLAKGHASSSQNL